MTTSIIRFNQRAKYTSLLFVRSYLILPLCSHKKEVNTSHGSLGKCKYPVYAPYQHTVSPQIVDSSYAAVDQLLFPPQNSPNVKILKKVYITYLANATLDHPQKQKVARILYK